MTPTRRRGLGAATLRRLVLLSLGALVPGSLASGQEGPAGVEYVVRIAGGTATVEGTFTGFEAGAPLTLTRLPGVGVELISPWGPDPLYVGRHLFRTVLGSGGSMRYRLTGVQHRIPLFVPEAPVLGGASAVRIHVVGVERVRGSFPRLSVGEGDPSAELANVPAFVMIPPTRLGLSYKDVFDLIILLAVVTATAVWLKGQRRAVRTSRAAAAVGKSS